MTHAAETVTINCLHFSAAGFWYVCHANLAPDSSGTRFRRRLQEHCSIQARKWRGRDWKDEFTFGWW